MRIDPTYTAVRFGYRRDGGQGSVTLVKTLEEEQYAKFYYQGNVPTPETPTAVETTEESEPLTSEPQPGHRVIKENQRGISYDDLFGAYLRGAKRIEITDPYLRAFYQVRNLMELMETIVKFKDADHEVEVHVVTVQDEFNEESQVEYFQQIQKACTTVGIHFSMAFDPIGKIHARHIVTDNGWKISLDRGLDIFQRYEMKDAFDFSNRLQQERPCKNFEITYLRLNSTS